MQNVNVNVKHRECLRDHPRQRLMIKCLTNIQIELEFGNVGLLRRGENQSTRRKTSRSKEENQQQTQPTYDAWSRNRTRGTLVGGECSHHCAIPAPMSQIFNLIVRLKTTSWLTLPSFLSFLFSYLLSFCSLFTPSSTRKPVHMLCDHH